MIVAGHTDMDAEEKRRTLQQNKSLHKWLEEVAQVYNAHGISLQVALRLLDGLDVPCTGDNLKHSIFKPILVETTGKESTADASPTDYTPIVKALTKGSALKMGVTLPEWPSRFRQD